ncbi:MAG: hypothetical protein ACOYNS_16835, partial [Bacteroidota bacterium]
MFGFSTSISIVLILLSVYFVYTGKERYAIGMIIFLLSFTSRPVTYNIGISGFLIWTVAVTKLFTKHSAVPTADTVNAPVRSPFVFKALYYLLFIGIIMGMFTDNDLLDQYSKIDKSLQISYISFQIVTLMLFLRLLFAYKDD